MQKEQPFSRFRLHTHSSVTALQKSSPTRIGRAGLLKDTRGLSTVEYLILMMVIVVGAVAVWNQIGGNVHAKLQKSRDDVVKIGDKKK